MYHSLSQSIQTHHSPFCRRGVRELTNIIIIGDRSFILSYMHFFVTFQRIFPLKLHVTNGTNEGFGVAVNSFMIPQCRTAIESGFAHFAFKWFLALNLFFLGTFNKQLRKTFLFPNFANAKVHRRLLQNLANRCTISSALNCELILINTKEKRLLKVATL